MTIENYGVPGVVAAGIARGVVERRREVVDYLPFPFVAPLRTDYRDCFRSRLIVHPRLPAVRLHSTRQTYAPSWPSGRTLPAPFSARIITGGQIQPAANNNPTLRLP